MQLKTILMEKEFSTGYRERYYDFCQYKTGFSIQRNGKTICGRLSGYGAKEIWAAELHDAKEKGWKVAEEYAEESEFYSVGRVGEYSYPSR
jgi:hypothetical protein